MKVKIGNEELDFHDDDALRSHSYAHAVAMTRMVPSKKVRRALEALFADVYFYHLKLTGWKFFHEARSHKFVPIEEISELADYLRTILGEPPATNDSIVTPPPADIEAQVEVSDNVGAALRDRA